MIYFNSRFPFFHRDSTYFSELYGNYGADWLGIADLSILYNQVSAIRIVMDIKANAKANMRLTPVDLSGEKITTEKATSDQKRIIKLMENPNPIHGTWEFLRLIGLYKEIWGRQFIHANVPSGIKEIKGIDGTTIKSLVPLPSQYMYPIYTGKIFSSTERKEVISKYELAYQAQKQVFETEEIFDRVDSNVCFIDDILMQPKQYNVNSYSKIPSITKEITNYVKALEGRNVTIRKLGARGIFTSGKKDAMGAFSLTDKERNSAQTQLDNYGAMENQSKYIVTTTPLQYQNIAFSPKELMLLEETYHAMIAIANVYQVPEGLIRLYVSGAGKEAEKELLKRLYTQTIIPESKDTADDLNTFLKTEKYGMRFVASFDHLDFLQEDKKDLSIRMRNTNIYLRDMWKAGAIVYNTWLRGVGLPEDTIYGDKRIFELTPEQVAVVLGTTISQDIPKK